MGHLILHDLDDDLLDRLKSRAEAHGRTLEEEHRAILAEVLQRPAEDWWAGADRLRAELKGRNVPNTTELVRQDRDRRAGLAHGEE